MQSSQLFLNIYPKCWCLKLNFNNLIFSNSLKQFTTKFLEQHSFFSYKKPYMWRFKVRSLNFEPSFMLNTNWFFMRDRCFPAIHIQLISYATFLRIVVFEAFKIVQKDYAFRWNKNKKTNGTISLSTMQTFELVCEFGWCYCHWPMYMMHEK